MEEIKNVKQGTILQSYDTPKFAIYETTSIEEITEDAPIAFANTSKECCKVIDEFLEKYNIPNDHYWRFIMGQTATFIDYGSWSKFMAVVPPLSIDMLMGEIKDD